MASPARSRGQLNVRAQQALIPAKLGAPFLRFTSTETTGGAVLLIAVVVALFWANSPWQETYRALWETPLGVSIGGDGLRKPLVLWINDGLMAWFFFVVGLEIKRELQHGELASVRRAMLPLAAAVGGMVVPAAAFLAINAGTPAQQGWGVPMATDIALALGVLALLGNRLPSELRVLLLGIAIIDDLGAILIIAIFYSKGISLAPLLGAAVLYACMAIAIRLGVRSLVINMIAAIALWLLVFLSGIHATIAGVLLALLIPSSPRVGQEKASVLLEGMMKRWRNARNNDERDEALGAIEAAVVDSESPLERTERLFHAWVSYGIIPLFALANAGVVLSGASITAASTNPLAIGILLGLVAGKPLGITVGGWLAVKFGGAEMPRGVGWRHIAGLGFLGGIGFTVALFIAKLAFNDPEQLEMAKAAILGASLLAALLGVILLSFGSPPAVRQNGKQGAG